MMMMIKYRKSPKIFSSPTRLILLHSLCSLLNNDTWFISFLLFSSSTSSFFHTFETNEMTTTCFIVINWICYVFFYCFFTLAYTEKNEKNSLMHKQHFSLSSSSLSSLRKKENLFIDCNWIRVYTPRLSRSRSNLHHHTHSHHCY